MASYPILHLALWAVLAVVIQASHLKIAAIMSKKAADTTGSVPLIPNPQALKFVSLGYDQMMADCWWLAFIQYYGDAKARLKDHCRYAYAYLDLITVLDPRFTQPYWFAAFAVGAEAHQPERAAELIERGIEANQDNWYIPYIAGINQYLFARNDKAAATYYRRAAKYPDAPKWLGRQAEILEAELPTLLKQIYTWDSIYNSTRETLVRRQAKVNLIELWQTVYSTVPSDEAKKRAVLELKALGVKVEEGSSSEH